MSQSAGNDRDRLAADLHAMVDCDCDGIGGEAWEWHLADADRLIALGWTRLDEERLTRALDKITDVGMYPGNSRSSWQEGWNAACIAIAERLDDHAAVAKAYREDTE